MPQSKEELEKHYASPDPWGYKQSKDDEHRKRLIVGVSSLFHAECGLFARALDIGAGEGWISQELPAHEVDGLELSDQAAARFPVCVRRVINPVGRYDLVVATGIWYPHYDLPLFQRLVRQHASNIVVVSGIADWLDRSVGQIGDELFRAEFPYPAGRQRLLVFRVK